jgi:hypothetical protein
MAKWKCKAMKAIVTKSNPLKGECDVEVGDGSTITKDKQKKSKCNEFKGKLEVILNVALFPTLANEATYCCHLVVYHRVFP